MLAGMLAPRLNANLGGRHHAAIEAERQIVQWVRQIFGFPKTASGLFVAGTMIANRIGVLVTRTAALALPTMYTHGSRLRQSSVSRALASICLRLPRSRRLPRFL